MVKNMLQGRRVTICKIVFCILFSALVPSIHSTPVQNFVEQLLRSHTNMHIGIHALSLTSGNTVCAINEHRLFTPASNIKLFTAVMAFEYLGPDYRFTTSLYTDGTLEPSDSIISGSLYVKGTGDPSFTEENLHELITLLASKGITRVTGNLYIDSTDFDQEYFQPGSFFDNVGYAWNMPTSALTITKKTLCTNDPISGIFLADSQVTPLFWYAHTHLRSLFEQQRITIDGTISNKAIPVNAYAVATHSSKPLSELLPYMLKNSDNLYADCFFKRIGALYEGTPGTWQKGVSALNQLFKKIGIDPQQLKIIDGAGRSRYNLIAPSHITALLQWAYTQPYFKVLLESLAAPGAEGTLKERIVSLHDHIRGKTGTLAGASALSGYAQMGTDIVAFSVLINGFVSASTYNPPCKTEIEDAFCHFLINPTV